MVYVKGLMAATIEREKDTTNAAHIPSQHTTVMVATRMLWGAGLVDNVNVTLTRGGLIMPDIERDD
jgi:hypothetical protein